jgi:hypothetical protein
MPNAEKIALSPTVKMIAVRSDEMSPSAKSIGASVAILTSSAMRYSGIISSPSI